MLCRLMLRRGLWAEMRHYEGMRLLSRMLFLYPDVWPAWSRTSLQKKYNMVSINYSESATVILMIQIQSFISKRQGLD
jgi:hypothetical protein